MNSVMSDYRYMRIIVFFDIPTEPESARKAYTKFRKFLINNGFDMLQYSVYTRICRNDTDAKKHITRIEKNPPSVGNVRILKVTNNQYENMMNLNGERSLQEKFSVKDKIIVIE